MKPGAVLKNWLGVVRHLIARGLRKNASEVANEVAKTAVTQAANPGLDAPALPGADRPLPRATSAQFLTGTFSSDAGSLDYKLFFPAGYRGQSLPLVVMLHGCKQDPDDFATGTRMNDLAEQHQCMVVYPAQSLSANSFRCWNWFNAVNQERDHGEPAMIAGITRDIIDTFNIDRARVYVAGLSAGGAMAVIMGTTYPELYTAVGVHSGLAYKEASDLYSAIIVMRSGMKFVLQHGGHLPVMIDSERVVPTIVFHGDRDTTVHPSNGDHVREHAIVGHEEEVLSAVLAPVVEQGAVVDGHTYTRTIYQDGAGAALAEQWLVHGAGHAWSGGSALGSYTDPLGPDASHEMLRFFLSQARA